MSFPIDLDEIDEAKLAAEIERRQAQRFKGLCDYCGRRPNDPPCKFPSRHADPRAIAAAKEDEEKSFRVFHGDKLIASRDTYDAAWLVIHQQSHGASVDWQMKHEGWRIAEPGKP